jgi:hypothetical protein
MTSDQKYQFGKDYIKHLYERSRQFNGNGIVNYPYAAGAMEMVIFELMQYAPNHVIERYQGILERNQSSSQ